MLQKASLRERKFEEEPRAEGPPSHRLPAQLLGYCCWVMLGCQSKGQTLFFTS